MNESYVHDSFDWWLTTLGGFALLHNGYTSTQPSAGKILFLSENIKISSGTLLRECLWKRH